jgi:predicted TIM-barrel fold metal-dependent hydrolase
MRFNRRQFGVLGAGAAAAALLPRAAHAADALPAMPPDATDCHNHIVGTWAAYPMAPGRTYSPPPATVPQLLALRAELGIARNVLVQPSFYGTDNSCMLDALRDLWPTARGIAVLPEDVSDDALARLKERGVRGIRLNLATAGVRDPGEAIRRINAFAPRFAAFGWHIQINTDPDVVVAIAPTIAGLNIPVVFDHFGGAVAAQGVGQAGFVALLDLVRGGHTYVKLSAPYDHSKLPDYSDIVPFARALIEAAPDHMLWGTNWPHPGPPEGRAITEVTPYQKIDNDGLLRAFVEWCPDADLRKRILVDNPARLYGFS